MVRVTTLRGLCYALVLFLSAYICAGGGDGSYLLFAIFGAPLSLIHPVAAIFGLLLLWPLCAFLLSRSDSRPWAVRLLILHLVGVCAVLVVGTAFESPREQSERFKEMLGDSLALFFSLGGLLVYVAGQVVAWKLALRSRR